MSPQLQTNEIAANMIESNMSVLQELIGRKVTVYSIANDLERQDVGVLEAVDAQFVKIRKSDTESMFFSLARVRLIKPFDVH